MRMRLVAGAVVLLALIFNNWWARCAEAGWLRCSPDRLYRGESVTVDLPAAHEGYDFAILGRSMKQYLISFKPGPLDRIGPVIAPGVFATMKQVKLSTAEARGSLSDPWRPDRPRALRPPQKIFIQSGPYEVLLSPSLGEEDADFDACWVRYFDFPRPQAGASSHSSGDAVDVRSRDMSDEDKRAFEQAVDRAVGPHHWILERDHYHVDFR